MPYLPKGRPLPGLPSGNDSVRNRPLVAPGVAPFRPQQPRPGGPLQTYQPGPGLYLPAQKTPFTLGQDESVEAVTEPDGKRVYLMIRNAGNSNGVLGVGFGSVPSSPELCDFEFAAGNGYIWDGIFVPQNRIWIFAFNGQCNAIINFANWEY
jgi:hypothetical protein